MGPFGFPWRVGPSKPESTPQNAVAAWMNLDCILARVDAELGRLKSDSADPTQPFMPLSWRKTLADIDALPVTYAYCPWDWDDDGMLA